MDWLIFDPIYLQKKLRTRDICRKIWLETWKSEISPIKILFDKWQRSTKPDKNISESNLVEVNKFTNFPTFFYDSGKLRKVFWQKISEKSWHGTFDEFFSTRSSNFDGIFHGSILTNYWRIFQSNLKCRFDVIWRVRVFMTVDE